MAAVLLTLMVLAASASAPGNPPRAVEVIVRAWPGAVDDAAAAVEALGGEVGHVIRLIDGFSATVPGHTLDALQRLPGLHSVTPNRPVQLHDFQEDPDDYNAATDVGSMVRVARAVNADHLWAQGYRGAGVGVAVIDSGVVPVEGLTSGVVNGADVSFETEVDALRHLDTYGHGTHMAGIIAGDPSGEFVGMAPDATLVNVKVAAADGATDVTQVLAAIDWVVAHRNDPGLNIRVLNLSFGTDGVQDYRVDPLAFAVEQAWRAGIVVVVAAGNGSFGSDRLNNPAYDPFVLTVGAADLGETPSTNDDSVPAWSARGDTVRNPDVVAPGRSIVSLRDPGSYIDEHHPAGRVGTRFFRGSGTSQAAAVVSGSAALLLQQRPQLTPDQVKALLSRTAEFIPAADPVAQGNGMVDLRDASRMAAPSDATQIHTPSTGTGSIEAARGSVHVARDGVVLSGEVDVFGRAWDGASWSGASWSGASWSGGEWSGASWSNGTWLGASWSGASWSGASWSGASWSGASWSGASWSGASWSGASWSGASWSGASWSGASWSSASWGG